LKLLEANQSTGLFFLLPVGCSIVFYKNPLVLSLFTVKKKKYFVFAITNKVLYNKQHIL